MAKDTEKLIRQLSLISFLMAERRPVTALEIKQEVEGYSGMNDDAFARRFYADRAELESLGIELKVRSEEHTSELQSRQYLVCRLLLEKTNKRASCGTMRHKSKRATEFETTRE